MYTIINGLNPTSVYLAGHLIEMEANVRIYVDSSQNLDVDFDFFVLHPWMKNFAIENELTSTDGLISKLIENGILVEGRINHVGKKFLVPNELPNSRMKDLFRILSESAKKPQASGQNADNQSKLVEDFNKSLSMQREDFEDCDFVIDTTQEILPSAGYQSVNFSILKNDEKIKVVDELETFPSGRVCLLGDDEKVARLILKNRDWLLKQENHLDVITHHSIPFEKIENQEIKTQIYSFFDELEKVINDRFEDHRKKVFEARGKGVKYSGSEPEEALSFYLGYSTLIIDKLYDREGYYLTIERPSFRAKADLKTIHTDFIIHSTQDVELKSTEEPGFFRAVDCEMDDLKKIETTTQEIVQEMMRFFSRNG